MCICQEGLYLGVSYPDVIRYYRKSYHLQLVPEYIFFNKDENLVIGGTPEFQ
jgi:hypothetical protein